jgi:tetratricopeptide (TPR) repeat protein
LRYAAEALDLATGRGAPAQVAWAHQYASIALRQLHRLQEAAASAAQAAEMFKAVSDIDADCQCLASLADCLRDNGCYEEALDQNLEIYDLAGDERSGMTPSIAALTRPVALAGLGECLGLLGRRAEAIIKLTEAISLLEQAQLPVPQARSLETLAALLADEGRHDESRRAYARAAEVFQMIGDADASSRCHDLATAAH